MAKTSQRARGRSRGPVAPTSRRGQIHPANQAESAHRDTNEPLSLNLGAFRALQGLTDVLKKEISEGTFGFGAEKGKAGWDLLGTAKELVRQLRQVRDDSQLSQLVDEATPYRLNYLKALTWCAEFFDYFGRSGSTSSETPTKLVEGEASRIRLKLEKARPVQDLDRRIAREEMWILLHRARASYRRHGFEDALQDLQIAERFVEQKLADERAFPCRLTLATLWCAHAHVLRQQAKLDEAASFYERAISRIREVLAVGNDRRRTRVLMETGRALGLGLGWILYTRGSLHNARAMIAAGLVCLDQTDDRVHKAYAELLLGCIRRAEAGFDAEALTDAIGLMDDAYEQLRNLGHEPYLARANYEMALAYLYRAVSYSERYFDTPAEQLDLPGPVKEQARADFRESEKHLIALERYAGLGSEPRDPRWLSNALIVRSRLERDRGKYFAFGAQLSVHAKLARDHAAQALKLAQDHHQTFCEIDALIAVAESNLLSGETDEVKGNLDEVIRLANGNPKVLGVAQLHYTRYFLARRDLQGANARFQEWERYRDRVEHGLIHHLAKKVEAEIKVLGSECLVIDSRKSLNLSEHAKDLLSFLIGRVGSLYPNNKTQQARKLEMAPATYEGHLKKLADPAGVKVILQVKKPVKRHSKGKSAGAS